MVVAAVSDLARRYLREPVPLVPAEAAETDEKAADAEEAGSWTGPAAGEPDWEQLEVAAATVQRFRSARRRVLAVEAGRVARSVGRSVADVMETLERIDQLAGTGDLGAALRAALDTSPAPDRVRVWQVRAAIDDLAEWRYRAAGQALSGAVPAGLDAAVAHWEDRHRDALRRSAALREAVAGGSDPVAVASLTLRRLNLGTVPVDHPGPSGEG